MLEFWFTTCGPCRQAVPHLNKLVQNFSPKGLRTYAVTFEPESKVRSYLKEAPIAAPIAIDTALSTIKAYGVIAYPTAVLIGKDGKVLAVTSPEAVTDEVVNDAIAGRTVKIRPANFKAMAAPVAPAETELPISSVRITPNEAVTNMSYSATSEKVEIKGVALRRLLDLMYRLDPNQSDMQLLPDARMFSAIATFPGGKGDAAMDLLKAAVAQTFHLKISVEDRETKVMVARLRGPLKNLKPWNGKDQRGAAGNRFTGMPLRSIIDSAAYLMGKVGIDETNDKQFYDFDLTLDDKKPIEDQMLSIYGIEVTIETRKIPFTTIRQEH